MVCCAIVPRSETSLVSLSSLLSVSACGFLCVVVICATPYLSCPPVLLPSLCPPRPLLLCPPFLLFRWPAPSPCRAVPWWLRRALHSLHVRFAACCMCLCVFHMCSLRVHSQELGVGEEAPSSPPLPVPPPSPSRAMARAAIAAAIKSGKVSLSRASFPIGEPPPSLYPRLPPCRFCLHFLHFALHSSSPFQHLPESSRKR